MYGKLILLIFIIVEYEKKFWGYDDTILFINIVESRFDELHHPKKRKHVWENISSELQSHNINVSANVVKYTNI